MMSSADAKERVSPTYAGFQKWNRVSIDDLPLIRPPQHHMLAHITGGLEELYNQISKKKQDTVQTVQSPAKSAECSTGKVIEQRKASTDSLGNSKHGDSCKDSGSDREQPQSVNCNSEKTDSVVEKAVSKESSDKGSGSEQSVSEISSKASDLHESRNPQSVDDDDDELDEESSPFTDEEGEFAPKAGMPLLASRYKFLKRLARGQSAVIIKAVDSFAKNKPVSIKVLHRVYKPIGSQEADILLELHRADPWLLVPFARLQNQFIYGPHYCLVFDFLSPTPLYTHYEQRSIKGEDSLPYIRNLCVKLLTVTGFLHKQNVIHADLKPENILLQREDDMNSIMVIDFGNALRNTEEELSLYYTDFELQTLLYRAPEVMFGLKFSVEIDMWSLGVLLAEFYLGQTLFVGKNKQEILFKVTKLLGPFPKEFAEGECAKEFVEFIGRPLSRYQRVENLRKKLGNCKDINFLLLVEKLLTYSPDRRPNPFEVACHPFVAPGSPFLYLTPSTGISCYPTVVLDMSTYPYLPDIPDEDDDGSVDSAGRKRLLSYSTGARKAKSPANGLTSIETTPAKEAKELPTPKPNPTPKLAPAPTNVVSRTPLSPKSTTPNSAAPQASPKSVQPASVPVAAQPNKKVLSGQRANAQRMGSAPLGRFPDTVSRSDVKETLKSMGLRCEDFTISVYSREQAHAILRKQGVEVTTNIAQGNPNYMNTKSRAQHPVPHLVGKQGYPGHVFHPTVMHHQQFSQNIRPSVSVMRTDNRFIPRQPVPPQNSTPVKKPAPAADDDDDDCVIIDSPSPPPRPKQPLKPKVQAVPRQPAPVRLPQQFQLMGTTVQVSRGAKRPLRGAVSQGPQAKRMNLRNRGRYYEGNPMVSEESLERASVQDTLKRLKNYNISITCRTNPTKFSRHMVDESDSEDMDESYMDEADDDDMSKYLECEIGEEEEEERMRHRYMEHANESIEEVLDSSKEDIEDEGEYNEENYLPLNHEEEVDKANEDEESVSSPVEAHSQGDMDDVTETGEGQETPDSSDDQVNEKETHDEQRQTKEREKTEVTKEVADPLEDREEDNGTKEANLSTQCEEVDDEVSEVEKGFANSSQAQESASVSESAEVVEEDVPVAEETEASVQEPLEYEGQDLATPEDEDEEMMAGEKEEQVDQDENEEIGDEELEDYDDEINEELEKELLGDTGSLEDIEHDDLDENFGMETEM